MTARDWVEVRAQATIGRLFIKEITPSKRARDTAWCRCACGKHTRRIVIDLRAGTVTDCGRDCPLRKATS